MEILKKLLLVIIILFPALGRTCQDPTKMHKLFFESNLIVEAKIVSHTDHYYKIKILDVYRDFQIGIKEGDYIKIKKEMNVETSTDKVHLKQIEDRLTGVAFLAKSEYGWRIREFHFFYKGIATIRFDYEFCEINGTSSVVKSQIQEYFKEFRISNGEVIGKKTKDEVLRSNLHQLALTQYDQLYSFTFEDKINCEIEEIVEPNVNME